MSFVVSGDVVRDKWLIKGIERMNCVGAKGEGGMWKGRGEMMSTLLVVTGGRCCRREDYLR